MTTIERTLTAFSKSADIAFQNQLHEAASMVAHGNLRKGALVKVDLSDKDAPAPAWYTPNTGDITFHVNEFLKLKKGKADKSHLYKVAQKIETWLYQEARKFRTAVYDDDGRRLAAEVSGVLIHEAAHTRWSTWATEVKESPAVVNTLMTFEEGRIEKRAVDSPVAYLPTFRVKQYLRAIGKLLFGKIDQIDNPAHLLGTWALVRGRFIAGTLTRAEYEPLDGAIRSIFGNELVDDLVDIYDEAMTIDVDTDLDRLIELAKLWNETAGVMDEPITHCTFPVPPPPGEKGEGEDGEGEGEGTADGEGEGKGKTGKGEGKGKGEGESGEPSDGGGSGGKGDGDDGENGEGDGDDGENGEGDGDDGKDGDIDLGELPESELPDELEKHGSALTEAGEGFGGKMFWQALDQVTEEIDGGKGQIDVGDPKEWANKVFGNKPKMGGGGIRGNWKKRPATPEEVNASNKLALHFESMVVPTIAKTKYLSEAPTGKIKSREAVRRSAERARGRMSTAKPWVATHKRHGMGAPVIIGIATDTSGSMAWAEDMVASTAYIVGRAGHRINAKTAAVTFGSYVEQVVNPDEMPTEVKVRAANGGEERFDHAMAALDGVLNLTTAPGAKVLVIVSDNELVRDFEPERRDEWIERLHRAGVAIVWIDSAKRNVKHTVSVAFDRWKEADPAHMVAVISKAVDEAFASKKQG